MTSSRATVVLCCTEANDLYRALVGGSGGGGGGGGGSSAARAGLAVERVDAVAAALAAAPAGAGVCLLADRYPAPGPVWTAELQAVQRRKRLRVVVEYPDALPGVALGEPEPTQWERAVVASDFFAPGVAAGRILGVHGCWFRRAAAATAAHLVVAKVAGYDEAAFGAPADAPAVCFQLDAATLVATTSLSRFVTARYGPRQAWRDIWQAILSWVTDGDVSTAALEWQPVVRTRFGPDDQVPADAEARAVSTAAEWFRGNAVLSIDRKKAAVEGYESTIDHRGRQLVRTIVRGDCTAETAMVLAFDWAQNHNPDSKLLATELLDTVWSAAGFYQDDPASPAYGHTNWNEGNPVFYGDDNARVLMATLTASRLLDTDRWTAKLLRCICANWRTTGPTGFRKSRLDLPVIVAERQSWMHYRDTEVTHYAPHYQAYLWAALLWAHGLTGYAGFRDKPERALRSTMARFPDWTWTNGLTQEMARILLPLAFLLQADRDQGQAGEDPAASTARHDQYLAWLTTVIEQLLADVAPCGTIRERLGAPELGRYPPPRSNADYGKSEAPVIQQTGDPTSDLLYSIGFAFLGLHEAAAATGDPRIAAAEDRLAEFLVRIQTECPSDGKLSGIWMRSFDDQKWEYWGSSADVGWGAFSIEAGWHNAWITAVLAMRGSGDTLFHRPWDDTITRMFPAILEEMLEERAFDATAFGGAASTTGGQQMPGAE